MHFETYVDKEGEHRWRLKANNGEIIASGEGYKNKSDMYRTINIIKVCAYLAKVTEVEG